MKRGALPGTVEYEPYEAEVALVAHLGSFLEISNPDAHGRVDMVASGAMLKALRTAAARALAAAVKEKLPDTGTTGPEWKVTWGPSLVDEVMTHREEPEMRVYRARHVAKDVIRDCALAEKKRSHKRKKR